MHLQFFRCQPQYHHTGLRDAELTGDLRTFPESPPGFGPVAPIFPKPLIIKVKSLGVLFSELFLIPEGNELRGSISQGSQNVRK